MGGTYWGIHKGEPEIDPITDNAVRVGWPEMTDLSKLTPNLEAFKKAGHSAYPEDPNQAVNAGGTLFRFVHQMKDGDYVVHPERSDKTLRIGRVSGPYEYHSGSSFPHWRPVEWIVTAVSRYDFSIEAQNTISTSSTLFRVSRAQEEFEAKIEQVTETVGKADYSWVPFYEQLADRIRDFRHDHGGLLERMWTIAERSGYPHLFEYLRKDKKLDGTIGALEDIDPFTFMSPFNRGIASEARLSIAGAVREVMGVEASAPTGFWSVPIVNNMNSRFIGYENSRGEGDVEALWDLFEAGLDYAEKQTENHRESLTSAMEQATNGQTSMLTMGLYWIRPHTYTAFDGLNIAYLRVGQPELAKSLTLSRRLTGLQYVSNIDTINAWLKENDPGIRNIPELSMAAYSFSESSSADSEDSTVASEEDQEAGGYDIPNIVEDGSFLSNQELEEFISTINRKKNLILQGPPGTGKTWLARRLAWTLAGERNSDRVRVMQFHPSLSYEDFVRGYRPDGDGALRLIDGPLLEIADRAKADQDENKYVLVIEEINRGNPAQIFGEMLTLLEADKRTSDNAISLAYLRQGEKAFHLPENLYIIGTMNVADRSLALVDLALRRRFAFITLKPQFNETWETHLTRVGVHGSVAARIGERIQALNSDIEADRDLGPAFTVGHSYFTPRRGDLGTRDSATASEQWYQTIVDTEIRPLLEEYWFEEPDRVETSVAKLLKG